MPQAPFLPGTTDRRLAALLTLLSENATIVISGARIAREVGMSRSTVWRWVQELRKLGVHVKGQRSTGYFLEKVPDVLTPDLLRKRLKGNVWGRRVFHFFKTDSTNRLAMELGYAGEPEGTIVMAEAQTEGRGRSGRSWHSEKGTGLYFTVLLRPKLAPAQAPLLTMLAGVSAYTAIASQTGLVPELKWPNDLLLNGKKLGGILTEMHAEPNVVRFVIVGVGINVNQDKFPPELSAIATSIHKETGRTSYRLELLVRLLTQFENDYNRFLREGPAFVIDRFDSVSSFARGRRVRVDTGVETYIGTTAGLSPEGLLLVNRDSGPLTTVIAGDVTEVR
ncbi:MAG TPA: biotin--[acetyl-CoA-carboxylase] ligase [Verrucomicrobiae bacterium]|nr:biotin--[acetyl-CoA-carboxylase] ligase [Verrucomicrobiae bacterium]